MMDMANTNSETAAQNTKSPLMSIATLLGIAGAIFNLTTGVLLSFFAFLALTMPSISQETFDLNDNLRVIACLIVNGILPMIYGVILIKLSLALKNKLDYVRVIIIIDLVIFSIAHFILFGFYGIYGDIWLTN